MITSKREVGREVLMLLCYQIGGFRQRADMGSVAWVTVPLDPTLLIPQALKS